MVKVLRKEILTIPKIDQKRVLTIAEKENKNIKQLIYYLSYLSGRREDKTRMINKEIYEKEKRFASNIETKLF